MFKNNEIFLGAFLVALTMLCIIEGHAYMTKIEPTGFEYVQIGNRIDKIPVYGVNGPPGIAINNKN